MNKKSSYLQLHLAVFLFGFTAILGDLISLSAIVLVWWRVLMASIGFFFIINLKKHLSTISKKHLLQFMGIGCIVGFHWICFFGSIKFANASIGLITMSTISFFTALLEPLILKTKIKKSELAIGLAIIPGMFLIANNANFNLIIGILIGLLSALLAALFAVLNKKLISVSKSEVISFIELSSAWLFVSLCLPMYLYYYPEAPFLPVKTDWIYLAILAFVCTTFAYLIALKSLKYLSAFASNLVMNLEPIYGIILAIIILQEHKELHSGFYWGGGLILSIVMIYPFLQKRSIQKT